ncbi:hypothetical protein H9L39_10363 [Fusarium oxysporum f. sp. albedinis]|nr:hypothetical protein H9L39_10363 [Fusarium oxysporum f. sp. albedinis]
MPRMNEQKQSRTNGSLLQYLIHTRFATGILTHFIGLSTRNPREFKPVTRLSLASYGPELGLGLLSRLAWTNSQQNSRRLN